MARTSVPPTYTKWNHKQTLAYFGMEKAGRALDDVVAIGEPDMYSAGNPVQATTTTWKELQVFRNRCRSRIRSSGSR